ncbi:MAG: hypothetical protein AB7E95_11220 [Kiritimatiellales bacterium]
MTKMNVLAAFLFLSTGAPAADRPAPPYRVTFNDDLTQLRTVETPYHALDEEFRMDMLKADVEEVAAAGFDAHMLAPLFTYVPAWKSEIYPIAVHTNWLKTQFPNLEISDFLKVLADGTDIVGEFVKYCREAGTAPILAVRMNDWHTREWIGCPPDTPLNWYPPHGLDQWRWEHPEYWLKDSTEELYAEGILTDDRVKDFRRPGLKKQLREERVLNWKHPEVRERMLGFIRELCAYDIDGMELDFMRHMQIFNLDETPLEERREIMGDFLVRVRALLDESAQPGKPRYLSMRVPSYAAAYDAYGFELEKLYDQGVDALTLSCNYYTVQQLDTENIHRRAPRLKLYPEITQALRTVDSAEKYRRTERHQIWTDAHIAYSQGASGISFFNFPYYRRYGGSAERALDVWTEPPFDAISVLRDPDAIAQKHQHYFLCTGWTSFMGYADATDSRLAFVIPSTWTEGRTRVLTPDLFPPAGGWTGTGRLRLQSTDEIGARTLSVKINGIALSETSDISEPYTPISSALLGNETNLKAWSVPSEILRAGENEIEIKLESGDTLEVFMLDLAI